MGVPRFFRWISERYPLINTSIDFENSGPVIDNLYLDMNGIIHNCSHANNDDLEALARITEEEIVVKIFQYIDRLFNVVKPQKLMYMAIDGVAPRAKMNQQRQRRFKSVKEKEENVEKLKAMGQMPPEESFDSNCITPGTEFMENISEHLKFFIAQKMNEDNHWKNIKVIFSGSEVPGEGEHKIMEYIRHAKSQPDWEVNQVHCIYGLDADLIMLSLVTHEPHFCLLREEGVLDRKYDKKKQGEQQEFHLLHISLLREYLELEFAPIGYLLPFEYDIERIIDDWILLCFLMGNDFVPSLPGLDIADGSLNELLDLYTALLPELDGYLTENGQPVDYRMNLVFNELASIESSFFAVLPEELEEISREIIQENEADSELANVLFGGSNQDFPGYDESSDVESYWKFNYYQQKFGLDYAEDHDEILKIVHAYLEAMCWIDHYYYHGCVSWSWFYPYHFPPLASDLVNAEWNISFELSEPFSPMQQLMAVLPPASGRRFLPDPYYQLMKDPELISHYPEDFELDLNGKKYDWEAIALISFLDAELIFEKTKLVRQKLSKREKKRDSCGESYIYTKGKKSINISSTVPTYFPDITNAYINIKKFVLPELLDENPFTSVKINYEELVLPPGMPSLKSFPLQTEIMPVHVNIFGNRTRKDSMLIMMQEETDQDVFEAVKHLFRNDCFLWPYNRQAKVVGLSTGAVYYTAKNKIEGSAREQGFWVRDVGKIKKTWYDNKAVDLGEVRTVASIRKLVGISRERNGEIFKRYDSNIEKYPLSLLYVNPITEFDSRFDDTYGTWPEEFPVSSKCVSVRKGNTFGNVCTVEGYDDSNQFRIRVEVEKLPDPRDMISRIISGETDEVYHSQSYVTKVLKISSKTLSKITAVVMFRPGNFNLGLKLKFSGKSKQTLGYTRRVKGERGNFGSWEYSEKTLQILKEYKEKFPQIFRLLEEFPERDAYDSHTLYDDDDNTEFDVDRSNGDGDESESDSDSIFVEESTEDSYDPADITEPKQITKYHPKILEAVDWIRSLKVWEEEQVDCGSSSLSPETITELTEQIDEWRKGIVPKTRKEWIYPESLIRPIRPFEVSNGNIKKAYNRGIPVFDDDIELGDRIVNLRHSGPIKFGARGTIIGIKGQYLEILLDEPAIGGVTLWGKVPALRGQVVSKGSVLNISQTERTKPKNPSPKKSKANNVPKKNKRTMSKSLNPVENKTNSLKPQVFPDEDSKLDLNWQQDLYFKSENPKKQTQPEQDQNNQPPKKTKPRYQKKPRNQNREQSNQNQNQQDNQNQVHPNQNDTPLFFNPNKPKKRTKWIKKDLKSTV